jgi:hypothetical protein
MSHDELDVRRWFRRRLQALVATYPELKDSDRQVACTRGLTAEAEEYKSNEQSQSDQGQAEG